MQNWNSWTLVVWRQGKAGWQTMQWECPASICLCNVMSHILWCRSVHQVFTLTCSRLCLSWTELLFDTSERRLGSRDILNCKSHFWEAAIESSWSALNSLPSYRALLLIPFWLCGSCFGYTIKLLIVAQWPETYGSLSKWIEWHLKVLALEDGPEIDKSRCYSLSAWHKSKRDPACISSLERDNR